MKHPRPASHRKSRKHSEETATPVGDVEEKAERIEAEADAQSSFPQSSPLPQHDVSGRRTAGDSASYTADSSTRDVAAPVEADRQMSGTATTDSASMPLARDSPHPSVQQPQEPAPSESVLAIIGSSALFAATISFVLVANGVAAMTTLVSYLVGRRPPT
jgi:hypothetical protein